MAEPPAQRNMSISYASITVPSTGYVLVADPPVEIESDYTTVTLRFAVLVHADDAATFASRVQALESAMRLPQKALSMSVGGTTIIDLDPASGTNSAIRTTPSARKPGHERADSAFTRLYQCEVVAEMPADRFGKNGLRFARIRVMSDESGIRRYEISGEYTALGSNNALAQYQAAIGTLQSTWESTLGGTWERSQGEYTVDDDDRVCAFVARAVELRRNQLGGSLNDPDLINSRITVDVQRRLDQDGADADPLAVVTVSIDAGVNVDTVSSLRSLWTGKIRPYLIQIGEQEAGTSSSALVEDAPRYDENRWRISGRIVLHAVGASSVIHSRVTSEEEWISPVQFDPVHSGDPYEYHMWESKATRTRTTRTERVVLFSGGRGGSARGGGGSAGGGGDVSISYGGGFGQHGGPIGFNQDFGVFGIFADPDEARSRIYALMGAAFGAGSGGGGINGSGFGIQGAAGGASSPGWIPIRTFTSSTPIVIGLRDRQIDAEVQMNITVERFAKPASSGVASAGPGRSFASGSHTQARNQ